METLTLKSTEMETTKCTECEALHGHHPKCSLIDLETAKTLLAQYYGIWLEGQEKYKKTMAIYSNNVKKSKKNAELWQGKYLVVKHENNMLRKKIE